MPSTLVFRPIPCHRVSARFRRVCAPGVHLGDVASPHGVDRREATQRRLTRVSRAVPNIRRSAALEAVQAQEGRRGVRQPRRGRPAAGRAHRSTARPHHRRRVVGPLVADGHPPCGRARGHATRSTSARTCDRSSAHPIGKLDRTVAALVGRRSRLARRLDLAPATIHRVVQLLNKCVNAAVEDRLIQHNPVAKLPLPRIERREMRFLTAEELLRLADAIEPRYRAFVLLGGFGGLRLGEMLGLRWGRVDLLRRRVHVAETLVDIDGHIHFGPPKTNAAVRSVPIPSFVCEELSRLADARTIADSLVFQSPERSSRFGRRCSAGDPGLRPSRRQASLPCASTIFGTPPSRCGSPKAPTPSRWPCSPATRPCRSCSIVTVTSTRSRTMSFVMRSSGTQAVDKPPVEQTHNYKAHPGRSAGVGWCRVMLCTQGFRARGVRCVSVRAGQFDSFVDNPWTVDANTRLRGCRPRRSQLLAAGGVGRGRQRLAARTAVRPTSRVMTAMVTIRLLLEPVPGSWGPRSVAGV